MKPWEAFTRPPPGWLGFCLRSWLAVMLALTAAFWFQLDSPSSAAVCVVILAQPTRGQALSKSLYRTGATVVGAVPAIVICAMFPQNRFLLLGGIGLWLAFCTFVGTLERDFRAYGAMLSGYTAAIVAPDGGIPECRQPCRVDGHWRCRLHPGQ